MFGPTVREARADEPEKRPVPDYDGRGPEKRRGEGLLWVPRILVSPLYLTSEFIVRRPLGALVKTAEENHWAQGLTNFFTFDTNGKVGLVPTVLYEFAFRPSIGAYFFWDDFLAKKNALRMHVATGGAHWYHASITDRFTLADGVSTVALRASWTQRPDWIFHGFGPEAPETARTRYGATIADVNAKYLANLWRASDFIAIVGLRDVKFDGSGGCCHDPTLDERVAAGEPPAVPPYFDRGYTIAYQRIEFGLDNRKPAPESGTGFRLEALGEHASDLKGGGHASWMKYGGTVGGFLDLTGHQRVLSLQVTLLFADPLRGDIPFTEQITLGGAGPMRGFRPGRLVDRSAAVATLQYQWPVWVFLDGFFHVAAGNVFGEHLAGFDAKLTRLSTGLGFRTSSSRDNILEVLFALGTDPLDQGLRFTSKRFLIGASRGF
ncbi:MAG: BamA/TamA family outer membrane protein [Polyangiales bacterium]